MKNPYYPKMKETEYEGKENSSIKKIRSEIEKSKKILEQFRKEESGPASYL